MNLAKFGETPEHQDNTERKATESDLGWYAGIMDGEGSFSINYSHQANKRKMERASCKWGLSLANTNPMIMQEAKRIAQALCNRKFPLYGGWSYGRKRSTYKPTWHLMIAAKQDVLSICYAIRPYIVGKKEQLELMISFLENKKTYKGVCKARLGLTEEDIAYRIWHVNKMHELNQRGLRVETERLAQQAADEETVRSA